MGNGGTGGSLPQVVVIGDARRMSRVADASVHLMVTSPPYWQLKDYGDPRQIGFGESYEDYLRSLGEVWDECERALHPGCRMAINIGDQFTRAATYGRYKVLPIREAIIHHLESRGLDAMGTIIWRKATTCNTSGGGTVMGSFPYPRNGVVKIDYEFILLFRKPGQAPAPSAEAKRAARMTTAEWNTYFLGHWNFPGARQEEHIAVFPDELPRRLIRMFTFPGETVLDPFAGSGTTLKAAWDLGRAGIGYEINPEFLPVIRRKVAAGGQKDLFQPEAELVVHEDLADLPAASKRPRPANGGRASGEGDAGRKRGRRGGGRFDALEGADPGGYGSVVRRGDPKHREAFRRVQEVKDIRTLVLDDGEEIRLLGVVPNARSASDGVKRLEYLVRSSPVYLRQDPLIEAEAAKPGAETPAAVPAAGAPEPPSPRPVYLYLKNRTFVNARLIREGLADPDRTRDYHHRPRFERYAAAPTFR